MPRVYKRVSNTGTTPVDVLERAAKAVDGGRSEKSQGSLIVIE